MWKDIPNYPGYQASTDGLIRSLNRNVLRNGHWMTLKGKLLKQTPAYRGKHLERVFVNPCVNGIPHPERVHKLVLITFVGPRPNGMEACHKDGDPSNNKLPNLRWDTDKNNQADSIRHGTKFPVPHYRGEAHSRSKLSNTAVSEIRATPYERGVFQFLAKKFDVSDMTIRRAHSGKSWGHV